MFFHPRGSSRGYGCGNIQNTVDPDSYDSCSKVGVLDRRLRLMVDLMEFQEGVIGDNKRVISNGEMDCDEEALVEVWLSGVKRLMR
ncbi:hypothetical protein Tco_1144306 [Tanacetum coccineum]